MMKEVASACVVLLFGIVIGSVITFEHFRQTAFQVQTEANFKTMQADTAATIKNMENWASATQAKLDKIQPPKAEGVKK